MRSKSCHQLVFLLLGMLLLAACGGGGGGAKTGSASNVTVTGVVSFPASSDRVAAKRTARTAIDNEVTVEAFTLDGVAVPGTSVHPTYDPDAATRIYSYSIPGLKPNQDYVVKARKGSQVLKRLVSKDQTANATLTAQTIDATSTAAVILASQKLSTIGSRVVLGDPLPTGRTVSDISAAVASTVKPALLEATITAAINTTTSGITTPETANYVNLYNVVVTAVLDNADPAAIFAGTGVISSPVPLFRIDGGTVTPPSSNSADWTVPTATALSDLANATAQAYTPPAETAQSYVDLAERYLAAQDIAKASLNYETALSIDPNNKKANFGGAITSGVMLMENEDVVAIVNRWGVVLPSVQQVIQGTSPVPVNFSNVTSVRLEGSLLGKKTAKSVLSTSNVQTAIAAFKTLRGKLPQQKTGHKSVARQLGMVPNTAPSVSEMQSLISNVIIPKIDQILSRLAKVEGAGFTFIVTKAMQGNTVYGTDVALNDCEFYTLDAALNIFQTLFEIATAYNFDIPSRYDYNTVQQDPLAILSNGTFFTLKSEGAARMNTALTYARRAAAKATSAYNALLLRSPGTGAFDLSGWTATDRSSFSEILSKISQALTGRISVPVGETSIAVDVTKFFTSPLDRTKLPVFGYDLPRNETLSATYNRAVAGTRTYTYPGAYGPETYTTYVECSLVPKSDLPDYTLNGILPDNSKANNVMGFNALLYVADAKLLTGATTDMSSYNSYTTDGTFAYTLAWSYSETGSSAYIKKVDLATGIASVYANLGTNMYSGGLLYFNGAFYAPSGNYNSSTSSYSINLTQVYPSNGQPGSGPTLTTYPAYFNMTHIGGLTASGNDVYYVVSSYDPMANSYRSDFYRLTGLGTPYSSSTLLFTKTEGAESYGNIVVSGNAIYSDSRDAGLVKMDMSGNPLAAYSIGSISWSVLVGGNFYGIDEERIIKYASLSSVAKSTLAGRFF